MKRSISLMDYKINTIKDVIEKSNNKNAAAVRLGVTKRSINRMIKRFKQHGSEGLVHGNTGRQPANTINKEQVFDLYKSKYSDFNIMHFTELMAENEGISVSESTVRNIFKQHDFLSPKAHRVTQRNLKKKLREQKKLSAIQKDQLIQLETVEFTGVVHPTQPRCKYFGEELQMDASLHLWFGNKKSQLHIAIDDATGRIVGGYFDWQETLNGYYHILKQILTEYGIPVLFKTDRRTVFMYENKKKKELSEDTYTQFAHACKTLGIELEAKSYAEFKPRVERSFQTLQGRLPQEMKLANVTTIEQANDFLHHYISKFNNRFAIMNAIPSCFEKQPTKEQIEQTLVTFSKRVVDKGNAIKLQNKYYATVDKYNQKHYLRPKTKVSIIRMMDGRQFALHNKSFFALEEIEKRKKYSPSVDFTKPAETIKKVKYIPPKDHPWRISNSMFFKNSEYKQDYY